MSLFRPSRSLFRDTRGSAAVEQIVVLGLVAAVGLGSFVAMGRRHADAIVHAARMDMPQRSPLLTSAQAGVGEVATRAAEAGSASHDAARFAEVADHVGHARLVLTEKFPWDGSWLASLEHEPDLLAQLPGLGWQEERLRAGLTELSGEVALLKNEALQVSSQRALIKAWAKAGLWGEARTAVEHMSKHPHRGERDLAVAMAEEGLAEEAYAALAIAMRKAADLGDRHDRVTAQRQVAVGLAKAGFADEAKALLAEATENANFFQRNSETPERVMLLREVAETLTEVGFPADAKPLLIEAHKRIVDFARRAQQDRASEIQGIAVAMAEAGFPEEAKTILADLKHDYFYGRAAQHVAMALHHAGFPDEAQALLGAAEHAAQGTTDARYRIRAQLEVADAFAQVGQREAALRVFAEAEAALTHAPFGDEMRGEVALALAKAGFTDGARATAARIDDESRRTKAEAAIARAHAPVTSRNTEELTNLLDADAHVAALHGSTAAQRKRWGAAMVDRWERFAEVPQGALDDLLTGAFAVAADVLSPADQARFLAWTEGLVGHTPGASAELVSRTPVPTEQARRSMKGMKLPEARMATRGLLVTSEDAIGRVLAKLSSHGTITVTARPSNEAVLQSAFTHHTADRVILHLQGLEGFTPAMTRELAYLMDNHPEVFVVAEAREPANVDTLLREKGRFGPLYQR